MRRAYDALGIQCPTSAADATPTGLHPNTPQVRAAIRLPLNAAAQAMPNLTAAGIGGGNTVRVLAPNQGQQAPNVSLPLGSDGAAQAATAQQNAVAQAAANLQQNAVNVNPFGLPGDGAAQQGLVSTLRM